MACTVFASDSYSNQKINTKRKTFWKGSENVKSLCRTWGRDIGRNPFHEVHLIRTPPGCRPMFSSHVSLGRDSRPETLRSALKYSAGKVGKVFQIYCNKWSKFKRRKLQEGK